MLCVFPDRNIYNRIQKLIIWDNAVDKPAPAIPILSPNINIGSPIILRTAPDIRPIIANDALPSNLRILFNVNVLVINGAAIIIKMLYVLAYGRIVAVLPIRYIIRVLNIRPVIPINAPINNEEK